MISNPYRPISTQKSGQTKVTNDLGRDLGEFGILIEASAKTRRSILEHKAHPQIRFSDGGAPHRYGAPMINGYTSDERLKHCTATRSTS